MINHFIRIFQYIRLKEHKVSVKDIQRVILLAEDAVKYLFTSKKKLVLLVDILVLKLDHVSNFNYYFVSDREIEQLLIP